MVQAVHNMLKICMDSKVQIKIELFKLMKSLMMACIPQMVIDVLLPLAAEHKNAKMREDVVNFVIFALLTFPSREFDLPEITSSIVPCLLDTKRRVRQAGLECMAIIHQVSKNGSLPNRAFPKEIDTGIDRICLRGRHCREQKKCRGSNTSKAVAPII